MKTLDEVIKALEYCLNPVDNFWNCNAECPYIHCCDPSNHDVTEDALHYLMAYRQLSRGLVGENTEIRPEGIYCKVCGTRLDKDWDDEDAG